MYSLYGQGYSLAQVGRAFGVTRQSVFKMFLQRSLPMRTVEPLPFIMWEGRKYTRRSNGYYARTRDGRVYLHADVWVANHGSIPHGMQVHHRDGNRENNSVDNLELASASDHGRKHGFAGNQYTPNIGKRPVR